MTAVGIDIPPEGLRALLVVGLVAFLVIPLALLERKSEEDRKKENWINKLGLGELPTILTILATLIWGVVLFVLILGLVGAILAVMGIDTGSMATTAGDPRLNPLTIPGITAALGATVALPLTLIRVQFTRRQTAAEEEGLITDRINAAVKGLGAEKEVNRHLTNENGSKLYHDKEGATDKLDFKRPVIVQTTEPNLEVRIGAILALERLARKNPDIHVQIMEILCAYIRENAPASSARSGPELITTPDDLSAKDRLDKGGNPIPPHWLWDKIRGKNHSNVIGWNATLPPTRSDIEVARQVISRRTDAQRRTEAGHGDGDGIYVFNETIPEFEDGTDPEIYRKTAAAFRERLQDYKGYRPDLRRTNLQGADLARFDLRGCRFDGAQMQGVVLTGAQMQGADLRVAQMQAADLWRAQMQGAGLWVAQMQGADLWGAQMQGAVLVEAQMQGAVLVEAQMQGADLGRAQMQGADLGRAQMQGAFLGGAQMQGADLSGAQMDDLSDLVESALRGAAVRSVDDATLAHLKPFWDEIYADVLDQVPLDHPDRPGHWPEQRLALSDFYRQWRAWQTTLPPDRDA